jgi:hypothetical protein
MTARYAFFRTPNGQPYRGADGKYAPNNMLADVGRASSVFPGGGVRLDIPMFATFAPTLLSAFVVIGPDGRELNGSDSCSIFMKSITQRVAAAPGEPIVGADLLKEADRRATEFYRLTPAPYVLVSSLSIDDLPTDAIEIRGCCISRLADRHAEFPLPEVFANHYRDMPFSAHLNSSKYLKVGVTVSGKSVHDAGETARDALTLLRGLWSLYATIGRWRSPFGATARKPLGAIHQGPVSTLHKPDGAPVEDVGWFDPEFTRDRELFTDRRRWPRIEENRLTAMKMLSELPYGRDLEDVLIRYAAALDQPNTDLAFLQLWGILEKITDTIGANYDETIRRAAWPHTKKSRPVAKEMLEGLRHRRNRYVHSGCSGEDGDQVGYAIKSLLDPHLMILIRNKFGITSFRDYGEFLGLPTELSTLEERHRRLTRAIDHIVKPAETESWPTGPGSGSRCRGRSGGVDARRLGEQGHV